jgi:formyl-CoA transferase
VLQAMLDAGVPAGPIYSAADIVDDPQYQARDMLETHRVIVDGPEPVSVRFPGIVPRLAATPGQTRWLGPMLGAHNDAVYRGLLGLDEATITQLQATGVI